MPLSEFYRMAKGKIDFSQAKSHKPSVSTDLSSVHESDFAELVWENGQLFMQGQSSRDRKVPTFNSLPSQCLPSHYPKSREKDTRDGANAKVGRFGTVESVVNEMPMSGEMGLDEDDEMVPWLSYPINQTVQNEYSNFLPELTGATLNELSSHNNFASYDKRGSGIQSIKDLCTPSVHDGGSFERGNLPKVAAHADAEAVRPKSSSSQPCPLPSQPVHNSSLYFRTRVSDNIGYRTSNASAGHAVCGDSVGALASAVDFPGTKMHKQDQAPSGSNSGIMNFSHFSRPAALVKVSLQNISAMSGAETMGSKEKGSALISSTFAESSLVTPSAGLRREVVSHCLPAVGPLKETIIGPEAKPLDKAVSTEPADAISQNDVKNDNGAIKVDGDSVTNGLQDCDKPVVASSSVCSGSSVGNASDEPARDLRRKRDENDESEYPSEDADEESVGAKKAAPARGTTGSKRSRAAEVHNLSERRRRDRINEKMRALQELIPNCNKVDKASMLDEAIEYLKTLQLQVQIMSMGAGLYMPPIMLPSGMQHMHAASMAHFSPMAMGVGMGYGMGIPEINGGTSSCPMVQMPPMHGSAFPGSQMSGATSMHGMAGSNLQPFGIPGQALPMSIPRAPLLPLSGVHFMKPAAGANGCAMVGHVDKMDSTIAFTSKDSIPNFKPQGLQNTGTNRSMNQTPGENEATNESLKQPAAAQDAHRGSEVTVVVPFSLSNGK